MPRPSRSALAACATILLVAACGSESAGPSQPPAPPPPPPPPPAPILAASVTIVEGDGQATSPSSRVEVAPTVVVRDSQGRALPGVLVTFRVTTGGGSLGQDTVRTGGDGTARAVSWRLGPLPGENRLAISADTVTPVAVTATARLFVSTMPVHGTVTLPERTGLDRKTLRVRTFITDVPVNDGGVFTALAEPGGVQLATVTTAAGVPVLLGWLDDHHFHYGPRSTAEVLAYFDLGAYLLETYRDRKVVRDRLAQADLAELEAAIAAALAAGPDAVTLETDAVTQARRIVLGRLLAEAAAAPQRGVLIDPAELNRSGLTLDQVGFRNLTVTNHFRRRVALFVDRLWYRARTGDSVSAVMRSESLRLPGVIYVTSITGAFADIISNARPTEPVVSSPVQVPLFPADALYTRYRVTVVGPGGVGTTGHDQLTEAQRKAFERAGFETIVLDIMAPLLEQALTLDNELHIVRSTDYPELVQKLADLNPTSVLEALYNGDVVGALLEAHKVLFGSDLAQNALFDVLVGPLARAKGVSGDLAHGFLNLQKLLGRVELAATTYAAFRSILDMGHARQIETWDVTVTGAEVAMAPEQAVIHQRDIQLFKANVTEATDAGPMPVFRYRWSTTGNFGKICAQFHDCGTAFESSGNAVTYSPDVLKEGTDQITVQVYYIERGVEQIIGEAKATVTTWAAKVRISPQQTSVETGKTVFFTASVDAQLLGGRSVTYAWSSPGQFGELSTQTVSDPMAWYRAGDAEGTETVTVEALAQGSTGVISLGKASATVKVERGRPTIVPGGFVVMEWPQPNNRVCIMGILTFPIVAGAKSYSVHAYDITDHTGAYGKEFTRIFTPPFPTFLPCENGHWAIAGVAGSQYLHPLSGGAGAASNAGNTRAWLESRFGSMKVDVTVKY